MATQGPTASAGSPANHDPDGNRMGKQYECQLKRKREDNKEMVEFSESKRRKDNKEKCRLRRAKNPEKVKQYERLWRARNPEKVRDDKEKKRLWMAKNPEKAKLKSARYYAQARWRANNTEKAKRKIEESKGGGQRIQRRRS